MPVYGVIVTGKVESLPSVGLAFAWTQAAEVPLILGQVNFFMEFDICFFRAQAAFEIKPKTSRGQGHKQFGSYPSACLVAAIISASRVSINRSAWRAPSQKSPPP